MDNNVASSWIASNDPIETNLIVGVKEPTPDEIVLYPNPVENLLMITASSTITTLQLRDPQGRLLETYQAGTNSVTLNLNHLSPGMYLITIIATDKMVVRKVVKL